MAKRPLISLDIKLLVICLAIGFIYQRIFKKDEISQIWESFLRVYQSPQLWLVGLAGLLMFFNWGLEASKWSFIIRKVETVSFRFAVRAVFTGITGSIFTPNRIGEFAGRVFLLRKADILEASLVTFLGSLGQLLITLVTGGLALVFFTGTFFRDEHAPYLPYAIAFIVGAIILLAVLAFLNFSVLTILLKRIRFLKRFNHYLEVFAKFSSAELLKVLAFSLGRYLIFSFQFYLLLIAFRVDLAPTDALILIPMTFLTLAAIPSSLLGELVVRESIALTVIGVVSEAHIEIVSAAFALWVINLAIPALIGSFFIFGIRIFRKILHHL